MYHHPDVRLWIKSYRDGQFTGQAFRFFQPENSGQIAEEKRRTTLQGYSHDDQNHRNTSQTLGQTKRQKS